MKIFIRKSMRTRLAKPVGETACKCRTLAMRRPVLRSFVPISPKQKAKQRDTAFLIRKPDKFVTKVCLIHCKPVPNQRKGYEEKLRWRSTLLTLGPVLRVLVRFALPIFAIRGSRRICVPILGCELARYSSAFQPRS